MRSAGMPMTTDATAPTTPASRKLEHRREVPVHVGGTRRRGPDGDERNLAEADLARPSGEQHERDRDDRVDHDRGGEVRVALVEQGGQGQERDHEQDAHAAEHPPHLG